MAELFITFQRWWHCNFEAGQRIKLQWICSSSLSARSTYGWKWGLRCYNIRLGSHWTRYVLTQSNISLNKVIWTEVSGRWWRVISVRLWNFKDLKKQDFWLRINILKGFFLNRSMNYGSSKSAKIELWKSIFYVKNQAINQQ